MSNKTNSIIIASLIGAGALLIVPFIPLIIENFRTEKPPTEKEQNINPPQKNDFKSPELNKIKADNEELKSQMKNLESSKITEDRAAVIEIEKLRIAQKKEIEKIRLEMIEERLANQKRNSLENNTGNSKTETKEPEKEPKIEPKKEKSQVKKPIQKIEYLQITLSSFQKMRDGTLHVTLEFKNIAKEGQGLAMSYRDERAGGIADYWKFMPKANSIVTDNKGNKFKIRKASGLGFGRTTKDWAILNPGESTTAILSYFSQKDIGNTFNISLELMLVYANSQKNQQQKNINIMFAEIKL